MQIALLTNLFPTPSDPNRGIFKLHLARALRTRVSLRVICPLPWFPSVRWHGMPERWRRLGGIPYRYEIDGVQVIAPRYPLLPRVSEHRHHRLMTPAIGRALRDLTADGPRLDLVHTHWLYPDAVAAQSATEQIDTPHVATGLGSDINEMFDDPQLAHIICSSMQRCDAVTVVASSVRERLRRDCPGLDVEVVLNGVDFERFYPVPQREARTALPLTFDDRPVVVWIGRLSAEKNPLLLLRAARRLAGDDNAPRFVVIGSGRQQPELHEFTATHDLSDHVELIGERPSDEIRAWLNAADVLALTSDCEGCPNVVLEALACGTPVVATDVGSMPDVITDANGRRVPVGDAEAMAAAIAATLQAGPHDRDRIAATAAHLSWHAAAERYCALYSRLLGTAP